MDSINIYDDDYIALKKKEIEKAMKCFVKAY